MFTTTRTDIKVRATILAAVLGISAMVPARWRADAQRAWSFAVYYVGFRVLWVQMSCGSWAVSGMPLVVKYAAG